MTPDWIEALLALQRSGRGAVLVTVAAVKGSAPRSAGTKMVVSAAEVTGTIGGGHLEFTAIDIARRQLEGGEVAQVHRFPLGASLGQCCGGVVNLLFEPIADDTSWVGMLAALLAQRRSLVVVTPLRGSHPNKLLVTHEAVDGSLGSAALDANAIAAARVLLDTPNGARVLQCSDDREEEEAFFFDPITPPDFEIVLFGAGHVGRALVAVLANIDCRITWVDGRDDAFPALVPANVEVVATDAPEAEIARAAPRSFFLVLTHDHALDERLSEQILRRADYAYFGLIGSLSKRRQFERRLQARGIAAESIATMTCPIGSSGIAGRAPGVIAVAVAAQLLQRREAMQASAAATTGMSTAAREGLRAHEGQR